MSADERAAGAAEAAATKSADLGTVARGGALNLAGTVANGVLTFAFGVVITRGLHAAGAGVFFEAIAVFTIATTVGQLGADIGVVRAIPQQRALGRSGAARTSVWVALVPVALASSLIGLLIVAFAPEISRLMIRGGDHAAAIPYLRILGAFVPVAATSKVLLSAIRGYGTMLPFVLIEYFGKAALRPVLAVAVIALGLGTTAIALTWAVPIGLGLVAAWLWFRAVVRRSGTTGGAPPRQVAKEFWSFTAFRGLASFFAITVLWLQVVLVGALGSSSEAGVYGAVTRVVTAGAFALQALFLVMGPQISSLLAQDKRDRATSIYQSSTKWLTAVSFPFYVTIAVFAPFFLRIFGHGFSDGQTALVVLSLAMLVNMGTGTVTVVLLMSGKSSWNLINTAAAVVINIALNIVLIPWLGVTGAAIAWAATIAVQNVTPLVQIWVSLKMHPFGESYLVPVVATAGCYGAVGLIVRFVFGMSVGTLIGFLVIATILYAGILWNFRETLDLPLLRAAVRARRQRAVSLAAPQPQQP